MGTVLGILIIRIKTFGVYIGVPLFKETTILGLWALRKLLCNYFEAVGAPRDCEILTGS